jgi:hypothetical protein
MDKKEICRSRLIASNAASLNRPWLPVMAVSKMSWRPWLSREKHSTTRCANTDWKKETTNRDLPVETYMAVASENISYNSEEAAS